MDRDKKLIFDIVKGLKGKECYVSGDNYVKRDCIVTHISTGLFKIDIKIIVECGENTFHYYVLPLFRYFFLSKNGVEVKCEDGVTLYVKMEVG